MKASVIVFPGSNCDRDIKISLEKFGIKTSMIWHADAKLPKSDLVVLPGGFSYGDYLRCGSRLDETAGRLAGSGRWRSRCGLGGSRDIRFAA